MSLTHKTRLPDRDYHKKAIKRISIGIYTYGAMIRQRLIFLNIHK